MIRLELIPDDAATLRDVLSEYASDLSMEIAGTDRKDYRDRLKEKKTLLRSLIEQLEAQTTARC